MNKKIVLACLAAIFAVILAGCDWATDVTKEQLEAPITVAVVTPLTGDAALWGQNAKQAIDLAYDNLDQKIKSKIKLVYEDDKCDPKVAVDAANKLINVDKVKYIVGTVCSSVTLGIAPITEANKVIMFSPCSSNPKVTQAGDYVFRNWPSDNYEGSLLAENAKNNLGVNKVAILYINNDYGVGLKDVFKTKFESLGGTVAVVESFDPNDKDFRTQLIKIKQAGVDAIYVDSNPEEQPLVLNQIKQMGIKKIILGNGPSTETQDLLQKAKSAAEGIYFVSAAWKNPDWFKEQYKAKYGQDSAICSDVSYDALTLVALAIDKCGADTACAKDNLYQVKDYDGVAGKTTLDSNGDVVGKDFILKVIKNGQFVPYQK